MTRLRALLARLGRSTDGTMLIETAIVAPVLVVMALGAFDTSRIVSRQTELQSAAAEASAIALSSPPDTTAKRTTLQTVLMSSTGLPATGVAIDAYYRCGATTTFVTDKTTCGTNKVSDYVRIRLTQSYAPIWTKFGVGGPMNFNVVRYALIKQEG